MLGHNYGNKICQKCGKIHLHPKAMLGKPPWNKGLTKNIDKRLKIYGEKGSIARKGKIHHDKYMREYLSLVNFGKKRNEETRKKLSFSKLGNKNPAKKPEVREKIRQSITNLIKKEGHPSKGKHLSEETKLKIKLNHWSRKIYENQDIKKAFFKKMLRNLVKKPNKKEQLLNLILQSNFPNEWKYVGSGDFWIGSKCPDFININGKNLVIELFGDYWHTKKIKTLTDTEEGRKQFFQQHGFSTLVIWDKELKYPEKIIEKVKYLISDSN